MRHLRVSFFMPRKKVIHLSESDKIAELINNGTSDLFYSWKAWKKLRAKVLKIDRYECQMCKAKGRYSRGYIVHHVKHLKDRPDLALSIIDPDTGERQLVTVCKKCHEELHPESQQQTISKEKFETEERWD